MYQESAFDLAIGLPCNSPPATYLGVPLGKFACAWTSNLLQCGFLGIKTCLSLSGAALTMASQMCLAGSFHMRSGNIPKDSACFDARSASGRRPEHVGGPRRPKAAAPSFARVHRVKQGATKREANEKPAESSADRLGF